MKPSLHSRAGFTLVELLVVIAIIGLLSTVAVVSLDATRKKARDVKRIADMRQIATALELYRELNGTWPANTDADAGCGGWDMGFLGGSGSGDAFIQPLKDSGLINPPGDPKWTGCPGGNPQGYFYYHYPAGSNGCDTARGSFYILGVADMETSGNPYPTNPGFVCGGFDWNSAFNYEWVTGKYVTE